MQDIITDIKRSQRIGCNVKSMLLLFLIVTISIGGLAGLIEGVSYIQEIRGDAE